MQNFSSIDFAALTMKVWWLRLVAIGNALAAPVRPQGLTTFEVMHQSEAPAGPETPFMGGWKARAEDLVSDPAYCHVPGNAFYMDMGD